MGEPSSPKTSDREVSLRQGPSELLLGEFDELPDCGSFAQDEGGFLLDLWSLCEKVYTPVSKHKETYLGDGKLAREYK